MINAKQSIDVFWNQSTKTLEYQWVGTQDPTAPIMVFLHEGLGALSHWQHWPHQLCTHLGYRGLVYSRYAYGFSTPRPASDIWQSDYLHIEAQHALPALLQALEINEPVTLFGHSDGASIALLYAAMPQNLAQQIIVLAPHIYMEPMTLEGVKRAIYWYENGDLKQRLKHYHADPDSAFWGWGRVWSDEHYLKHWNIEKEVAHIRCPLLAIQGTDDEYASLKQIYDIQRLAPQTQLCILEHCRHSPHIDMPERVIEAVEQFLK